MNKIITFTIWLLLLATWAAADSPVWEPPLQENYDIDENETIIIIVRATDADGDTLRLSTEDFDIVDQNASFIDNGDGTGTFSWTPTLEDMGVYEISFGVTDQPMDVQPLTWNWTSTMITVHDVNPDSAGDDNTTNTTETQPPLSAQEQEYGALQAEFDSLEDDYSLYKRRYERAVDEDDEQDIDEYEENLEDVDNELADLEEEVENLIEDVEDSDLDNRLELLDNLEELMDDISTVRERIDDLFNWDEPQDSGVSMNNYNPLPQVQPEPRQEGTRVVVQPLDYAGSNAADTPDDWQETRKMVWIGAGIVVLIAVIVFLVALML